MRCGDFSDSVDQPQPDAAFDFAGTVACGADRRRALRVRPDTNPLALWLPSQNGLFFDARHRHKASVGRVVTVTPSAH